MTKAAAKAPAPRVSVVTPMFNAEKYIEAAVRSVLAQTFVDFEYIIVNDGSTDGCGAIVDRLAAEDGRIKVIHLAKNMGNSAANNAGFAIARGEYVACMDADDVNHPERLARQVAYLDTHADVGLVATQYWKIDTDGKILRKTRNRLEDVVMRFYLFFGVPVCNPTTFFRREVVETLLPHVYDPKLKTAADYDFLVRVAATWRMHVLPEYLFYYRVNPNGLSKTKRDLLIEETVSRAVPLIRATLPKLTATDEELAVFVGMQAGNGGALTRNKLADYLRTLHGLCDGYCAGRTGREARLVKRFVLELEIKTLLVRYRVIKKPGLMLFWLLRLPPRVAGLV